MKTCLCNSKATLICTLDNTLLCEECADEHLVKEHEIELMSTAFDLAKFDNTESQHFECSNCGAYSEEIALSRCYSCGEIICDECLESHTYECRKEEVLEKAKYDYLEVLE